MTDRILAYDTETTSEKPATCRVVQVAGILRSPGDSDGYRYEKIVDEICDPGLEVSDKAFAIHGISQEMIDGCRDDAIVLRELYQWLEANYMIDGTPKVIVAGHNVRTFDLEIMWKITGESPLVGLPIIDTLVAARRLYWMAPTHKLTTPKAEPGKTGITEWLGMAVEGAHSAAGDAMMVFNLVDHFCKVLEMTPMQLATWCMEPRVMKYCPIGMHKGKLFGKPKDGENQNDYVPVQYAWWIAKTFEYGGDFEYTLRSAYGIKMYGPRY